MLGLLLGSSLADQGRAAVKQTDEVHAHVGGGGARGLVAVVLLGGLVLFAGLLGVWRGYYIPVWITRYDGLGLIATNPY